MSSGKAIVLGMALMLPMAALADSQNSYRKAQSPLRPLLSNPAAVRTHADVVYAPMAKAAPNDGRDYETVIEEDFSLCTAGSVEDPDPNFIENASEMIPAKYTHTPGWGGRAIMQAGGAICIGKTTDKISGEEMTGQIELPQLDLHRDQGRAYLSFRAKALPADVDLLTVRWYTPGTAENPFPTTGDAQQFYIHGVAWTTIDVDLTDCPEDAIIQIYSEYAEWLIDDVKLEQFQPEIDAPKALKWSNYTGDSFRANWSAVEGADHYILNVFYIRREGSEDQLPDYKYIVKDRDVTENYYDVTGVNPDKVYYYYVRSVDAKGNKSEESQVVEVLDLTVPAGIVVSDVTADGFRINWDPVHNAEGYGLQFVLTHTAQADEDYALLDEHFDAISNEGSIGTPMVNTLGYYDMDSFGMTRGNWVMYEGGVIDGGICLHNYISDYGTQYYGELLSPIMTIGQSTGEITIEADCATLASGVKPYIQIAVPGVVDGATTWVLGAGGEMNATVGSDWTHVKQTYKVKPGLVQFSFGCTDGGWLYIDNIRISVKLPKDAVQKLPYKYDELKENIEAPEYYLATADRQAGDHYSFAIMAARQKPGSYMMPVYVTSEWSDEVDVPDPASDPDGICDVTASAGFSAVGTVGSIAIANPAGTAVTVLDLTGRTVAATSAAQTSVACPAGMYIVAAEGALAVKVIVK